MKPDTWMQAGLCRHCGGLLPCRSIHGDHDVGVKHTPETLARRTLVLAQWAGVGARG